MPPLFDDMQIANALRTEALPALERLAGNSFLRDRALERRFDRDEPPPYVSSTEDDYEDMADLVPGPVDSAALDELASLLDKPLDDDQRARAVDHARRQARIYSPGARYDQEVKLERERIERWMSFSANKVSNQTRDYFVQYGTAQEGRAGVERINVIARRNIKRRWQKLGVWNPEWGVPGRMDNPQPNDNTWNWKWPWQHGDAAAEWQTGTQPMSQNPRHPITRALRLRQDMRRSEHSPVLPRSHLEEDAPASQAESFIMSRPWFVLGLEVSEEGGEILESIQTATGSLQGLLRCECYGVLEGEGRVERRLAEPEREGPDRVEVAARKPQPRTRRPLRYRRPGHLGAHSLRGRRARSGSPPRPPLHPSPSISRAPPTVSSRTPGRLHQNFWDSRQHQRRLWDSRQHQRRLWNSHRHGADVHASYHLPEPSVAAPGPMP